MTLERLLIAVIEQENKRNSRLYISFPSFRFEKRDFIVALCIAVCYFIFRIMTVYIPNEMAFDEVYYIPAASDYLNFHKDSNWVHPPLAKMLIAAFSAVCPFVGEFAKWRIASCFFGSMSAGVSYLLGLAVLGSRRAGLLASFFVFFDFLLFVFSGIALLDIFLVFFMGLSALFLRIALSDGLDGKVLFFVLASVSAGFAGACKWSGIFSLIFIIFSLLCFCGSISLFERIRIAFLCCSVFMASYFIPYAYYFLAGGTLEGLASTFCNVLSFQIGASWTHGYLSPMWKWVFMVRPVWVWFAEPENMYAGIIAMGNPVFWWSFPCFFILLLVHGIRKNDGACLFIGSGYLMSFVLWIFSGRQGFFYYMAPAVIWMALGTAKALLVLKGKSWAGPICFCIIVFAVFEAYFPFLAGLPVSKAYYAALFFIKSWI